MWGCADNTRVVDVRSLRWGVVQDTLLAEKEGYRVKPRGEGRKAERQGEANPHFHMLWSAQEESWTVAGDRKEGGKGREPLASSHAFP